MQISNDLVSKLNNHICNIIDWLIVITAILVAAPSIIVMENSFKVTHSIARYETIPIGNLTGYCEFGIIRSHYHIKQSTQFIYPFVQCFLLLVLFDDQDQIFPFCNLISITPRNNQNKY